MQAKTVTEICGVMSRTHIEQFQRKLPDLLLALALVSLTVLILLCYSII